MTTDEKDAEIAALRAQAFADREAVAKLALDMGFSTGHGDTIADILMEVRPQIDRAMQELSRARDAIIPLWAARQFREKGTTTVADAIVWATEKYQNDIARISQSEQEPQQ